MIRVLQVLGGTNLGGAESRIMDLYRHMDRENVQFDFLITEGNSGYFTPEIQSLGGKVYTVPKYRIYNHAQYIKAVKQFFKEHNEFVAVHGHMTSTAGVYLPIAKKAGIPLTIAHARSAGVDKGIKGTLTRVLRKGLARKCDMCLSCSDLAAVSVFGQEQFDDGNVKIMPNAIAVADFAVDEMVRKEIRARYAIEDKLVIGHVGRFHSAKNHEFLIKVFGEFVQLREDAVLMIVGDGTLREQIVQWIDENDKELVAAGKKSIKDKIILTGSQTPVDPFYQAFDLFLFPSFYEGMPGTVVEAQASGVKCLISDTITRQVKITDIVEYESLKNDESHWAKKLISLIGQLPVDALYKERVQENRMIQQIMLDSDYNVNKQVEYYTKLYSSALR